MCILLPLLSLALMLSEARAQQTFLYTTPAVQGNFGNRSVANAICAAYSGLSCSYTTALVFYAGEKIEEFPLPINEPVFVGVTQVSASWVGIASVPFATYFPPFWSGMYSQGASNVNCLNWQSAASCSKGIVGYSSLRWYTASCATRRVILCACNGGTFGPTLSPTTSIPSAAPSTMPSRQPSTSVPSKAPTFPTPRPSGAPSRTPTTSIPTKSPTQRPTSNGQRVYGFQILPTRAFTVAGGGEGGITSMKATCEYYFAASSPSGRTRKAVPFIQLSGNNYCSDVVSMWGINVDVVRVFNYARQLIRSSLNEICYQQCNGGVGSGWIFDNSGVGYWTIAQTAFISANNHCNFWTSSSSSLSGYFALQDQICSPGSVATCDLKARYLCLVEVLEVNGVVEWVQ